MNSKHLFIFLTLLVSTSLVACGDKPNEKKPDTNQSAGSGKVYDYCGQNPKPTRCTQATKDASFGKAAVTTTLQMKTEKSVLVGGKNLPNDIGSNFGNYKIPNSNPEKTANDLLKEYIPAKFSLVMEFPEWTGDQQPTGKTPLFVWLGEDYDSKKEEVKVNDASVVKGGSASAIALEGIFSQNKFRTTPGKLEVPIKLGDFSLTMKLQQAQVIVNSATYDSAKGVLLSEGLIAGVVEKNDLEKAILDGAKTCDKECISVDEAEKSCTVVDETKCTKPACKEGFTALCDKKDQGGKKTPGILPVLKAALFGEKSSAGIVLSFEATPVKIAEFKKSSL